MGNTAIFVMTHLDDSFNKLERDISPNMVFQMNRCKDAGGRSGSLCAQFHPNLVKDSLFESQDDISH
jgi:hypothetical protein